MYLYKIHIFHTINHTQLQPHEQITVMKLGTTKALTADTFHTIKHSTLCLCIFISSDSFVFTISLLTVT